MQQKTGCVPLEMWKTKCFYFLLSYILLTLIEKATVVNESSDPLPEIQTGDPGSSCIASTAKQVSDQINVLIYHGDMERSDT